MISEEMIRRRFNSKVTVRVSIEDKEGREDPRVYLIGVYLTGVHLTGVHLRCVPYKRASHGCVPHKRASHRRAPNRRVSHGCVPHKCASHRRTSRGRVTRGYSSRGRASGGWVL